MARARSDVEALSRSFRSRILLLALVIVAGLLAALWTATRKTGKGAAEDRRKIMVVADSRIDYYAVLERAGFEVEVARLDEWETEANGENAGVAAVLELADERGFALVVFEAPAKFDFEGVDLEPGYATIEGWAERRSEHDYAAVSVGDFAFPHRLSVDDPGPDPWVRMPGFGALQAVFRQPLISARNDPDRPTLDELQFEDAIKPGRHMVERPSAFAATVELARGSLAADLDDGSGALALLPTLATGSAIPTPDGGIVLLHHALVFYSTDARTLTLEAPAQMQISWLGPAAVARGLETGEFELESCPALAGGALAMAEAPRIEAALDGSAVAIGSSEAGATLWRKREGGCAWEAVAELGSLDSSDHVELAPRLAGGDRILAGRVFEVKDRSWVSLSVLADEPDAAAAEIEDVVVLAQTGRRFGALAFVDDQFFAVISDLQAEPGTNPDRESRVYLLDHKRPGVYLSVPAEFFAEGRELGNVVALAPADEHGGPTLLVSAYERDGSTDLIHLRLGGEVWAAYLGESDVPADEEARMVSLTPEDLETVRVGEIDQRGRLGVSPRGERAVYEAVGRAWAGDIGLIDLTTGARGRLTDNDYRDYLPRFAADENIVTFVSLMRVRVSPKPFSVPRILSLPANEKTR
jgi:hypothetical protein